MDSETMPRFEGKAKKIRLISNSLGYGPWPDPGEEVEQHLTIAEDGRVWFYGYGLSDGGKTNKLRSERHSLAPNISAHIIAQVAAHFADGYSEVIVMDAGSWDLEITNDEGQAFRFHGPLCAGEDKELSRLSDLIRYHLGLDYLAFDGDSAEDQADRIKIEYRRVTKIKPKTPLRKGLKYAVWDYRESFVIDRESETMTYKRMIGSGCDVTTVYHVEEGVREFLNGLDAVELFTEFPEKPKDAVDDPMDQRQYVITIDFKNSPQITLKGDFDRDGLPNDWAEFADDLFDFINFYAGSEMLSPAVYDKPKRRSNSLIFCSVVFEEGGKTYYYLADEDIYEAGEQVVVPVQNDDETAVARIVRVEYFSKGVAPFPLDRMKHILRKVEDGEDVG